MSNTPELGALVYISTKPLLKFALPVSFGFLLTKRKLFSLAASRGVGQLILNMYVDVDAAEWLALADPKP